MLESVSGADNILYACCGGDDLIRTECVCNTSPSSFLIKLPSYYFMWITVRTRVLPELHYKSSWKNRANWVKWIIWTQVCWTWLPFRANIIHKQCFILDSPWQGWVRLLIPLEGAVRTDIWQTVFLVFLYIFRSSSCWQQQLSFTVILNIAVM